MEKLYCKLHTDWVFLEPYWKMSAIIIAIKRHFVGKRQNSMWIDPLGSSYRNIQNLWGIIHKCDMWCPKKDFLDILFKLVWILEILQVTLDEATVQKVLSEDGFINKADFIKLGQDLKLLEFGGAMGEKRKAATPKKERRVGEIDEDGNVMNSLTLKLLSRKCLVWRTTVVVLLY